MSEQEVTPTGCAADPPVARAGYRADRAWRRPPDCELPRDRPRDAIAHTRGRIGNYGNIRQSRVTTANLTPPTMPPRSKVPSPARPAPSPPWSLAVALPRPAAGAARRLPSRNRRNKPADDERMFLPAVAPPHSREAPVPRGGGKPPGRPTSRWHSRRLNTLADCSRRYW